MADTVTLPGTGAVIATDQVIDGTLGTVQVQYAKIMDGTLDSTNKLIVNSSGAAAVTVPDQQATGSLTAANSAVTQTNNGGISTSYVQITGTWAGTVVFEGTVDGTNFFSVPVVAPVSGALITSTTASGAWAVDVAGLVQFRARCSVYTSGTIVTTIRGSMGEALFGLDTPLPTGTNVIGAVTGSGSFTVAGLNGVGSTASGNPVRLGAVGKTTNPTGVSDGQVANVITDKVGRLVVVQGHTRELVGRQTTTITSSTTAATIVTAGAAGVFNDLTSLAVTNGSATATTVTLSDGTALFVYSVGVGGGFVHPFNPPLAATTAATAWTLTCGTSVASIYVNVTYVKNV